MGDGVTMLRWFAAALVLWLLPRFTPDGPPPVPPVHAVRGH